MQAIVMAGGHGRRLRPYTDVLPKPLTPIGDMPVVEIMLRRIAAQGVTHAIVCTGAKARIVEAYLRTVDDLDLAVVFREDREPQGTGGALRALAGLLDDDYLVVNADVMTDADIGSLMRVHRERHAAATVAIARRDFPIRYGTVETAGDGAVAVVREKPVVTVDVNLGMYAVSRARMDPILREIQGRVDMPDLVARLLERGDTVAAARFECRWFDIGEEVDLVAARESFSGDPEAFLGASDGPPPT